MTKLVSYVPHGINPQIFFPIQDDDKYDKFKEEFYKKHDVDFVIFWNNRNIRRKSPGDVILAYRRFCDLLSPEKSKKCILLMKTQVQDENGTDLIAVKKAICPKYKIAFNEMVLPPNEMNYLYNLADVTINIASNEGFGLSNAESIMAGTVTITNVTGGLQDQCRFSDHEDEWIGVDAEFPTNHAGTHKDCGPWTIPVFPSNRSLQGSIPTPYIFDDRCDFEDVANAILTWYNTTKEQRDMYGEIGRQWLTGKESGMSTKEMSNRFIASTDKLFEDWKVPEKFELVQYKKKAYPDNPGIVWKT